MKRFLLFLVLAISFNKIKAQVVFCPPGAKWHVMWNGGLLGFTTISNRTVEYVRDSLISTESYPVLQCISFYAWPCTHINSQLTLIRQSGDTVFFRNNNTNHTWQILYNFAATAGQTWTTSVRTNTSSVHIHTITVQSVSTVTLNNFPLRVLNVSMSFFYGINSTVTTTASMTITERLGSSRYLFYFHNKNISTCDAGSFSGNLCYQDDKFGVYQYASDKPCNFTNVGINEFEKSNSVIKLYPNPVNSSLNIDIEDWKDSYEIRVQNALGQRMNITVQGRLKTVTNFEISDLKEGIYLLQVLDGSTLIGQKKFRKE